MENTAPLEKPVGIDELRWTRRELRALRATQALADLMATRPELRGVHAPADFVDDAVRWCA